MIDPIVDEVRQARDKIAARCGYDLDRLADYLERKRKREGIHAVRLPAVRIAAHANEWRKTNAPSSAAKPTGSSRTRKRKAG